MLVLIYKDYKSKIKVIPKIAIMKRQLLKPNTASHLLHFIILLNNYKSTTFLFLFLLLFIPSLCSLSLYYIYISINLFFFFFFLHQCIFHGLLDYKFYSIPFNLYVELTTLLRLEFSQSLHHCKS